MPVAKSPRERTRPGPGQVPDNGDGDGPPADAPRADARKDGPAAARGLTGSLLRPFRWLARMAGERRKLLLALAAGMAGGLLLVSLFGTHQYTVGPLQVELGLRLLDRGTTRIVLPPAGQLMARTHMTPLEFSVTLQSVDIDALRETAESLPGVGGLTDRLRDELVKAVRHFLVRSVVLAAVGGGLGVLIFGFRRRDYALKGTAAGLAVYSLLLGAAYASYDVTAFREPKYSGVLKAAPWMVGLLEESLLKVRELGDKFSLLAQNLVILFERIDALEPLAAIPGERVVLVVSDIHNNPAAIDFIGEIVRSFKVDLIVDGGDLTDFGTALEGLAVISISELGLPYILAPGNHESPEVIEQLSHRPNASVLMMDQVDIDGITIAGAADPSSATTSPRLPSPNELRHLTDELEQFLAVPGRPPPDILVVHNPQVAAAFVGRVPTVINGHTHTIWVRNEDGTVWLNPGTTGAAGIRGLQTSQEMPYSLILAYMERNAADGSWYVTAADTIRVFNFRTGFQIERHTFPPPAGAVPPDTPEQREGPPSHEAPASQDNPPP